MARGNGMLNWFRKYAPCFSPEEHDRMSRSGDSRTPRTPRTNLRSVTTGLSREGGNVASTSRGGGNVASTSRGGGDVAGSITGGGDVAGSSRGGGDVAGSSKAVVAGLSNRNGGEGFWSRDLDTHFIGNFSFAVIKGNIIMEDYSEVVIGREATFIGVYDGHSGRETSKFVSDHIFSNFIRCVSDNGAMSNEVLTQAFLRTDMDWAAQVESEFEKEISIAAAGTSCLVGVIWREGLYVANVGDSRAILVRTGTDHIGVLQLTRDDNIKDPAVREEVLRQHLDEPDFIVEGGDGPDNVVYRIRGRTELSKSIGDACLKYSRFNIDGPEGFDKAAVSAKPSPQRIPLRKNFMEGQQFVIFGSHGFWSLMENEEVARIMDRFPQKGIAARLIREALVKAATKAGTSYDDVLNMKNESGTKLHHDDITVVVISINKDLNITDINEEMTIKIGAHNFHTLDNLWLGVDMGR